MRQEGRGIGLINKIKAYALQQIGIRYCGSKCKIRFAPDLSRALIGAQILSDLGVNLEITGRTIRIRSTDLAGSD